jgi:hypothetical protein
MDECISGDLPCAFICSVLCALAVGAKSRGIPVDSKSIAKIIPNNCCCIFFNFIACLFELLSPSAFLFYLLIKLCNNSPLGQQY